MRLRIRPKFWLIVITLMIIAFSTSYVLAQQSLSEGRAVLAGAMAERDVLRGEVETLKSELAFTQTDEYVIRVARDELSMNMPGEIRYISSN